MKQLEEQRLAEERRREMEKLDNWRERGLNDMMGGVLQVRREDELKKVEDQYQRLEKHHQHFSSFRKFPNHHLHLKNQKMNGQKQKNKFINSIFRRLKNNKKNEINSEKYVIKHSRFNRI